MSAPTLTFDREAAEFIVEAFGWHLTETGYLWGDDCIMSICNHPVNIDEFAGVVEYEGEPTPLRDDFNELVEYVKYRHDSDNDSTDEGGDHA